MLRKPVKRAASSEAADTEGAGSMTNRQENRLVPSEYRTTREAAKFLRVSEITLWRLRKNGLPFHRVCSKVLYDLRDLEAFMAEHKRNGGEK